MVGAITFASGGVAFAAVLLAFFVPSVLLSRVGRARKRSLVDIGKGGARDWAQVLANGGVATVCAAIAASPFALVVHTLRASIAWSGLFYVASTQRNAAAFYCAFAGAYAAATADTWGTEVGTVFGGDPRSVLTLRPLARGLSGGVTLAGTLAEVAGAAWLAAVAAMLLPLAPFVPAPLAAARVAFAVAVGGIAGAFIDSLLGATLQERRFCPVCKRSCETDPHVCGSPTRVIGGLRGFGNDIVNAAATAAGAAIAFAVALA